MYKNNPCIISQIYLYFSLARLCCAVAVAGATRVLNCRGIYTILNPPSLPPQCPFSLGGDNVALSTCKFKSVKTHLPCKLKLTLLIKGGIIGLRVRVG